MTSSEPLLSAQHVSKKFDGLLALSDVSFTIAAQEIFGLIGPNGAGKTTLFNVLTGVYALSSGEIFLLGKSLAGKAAHEIAALGIARTFQNIRLFANMSALENVMVGRHVRTRSGAWGAVLRNKKNRIEEAQITERAQELLAFVGIAPQASQLAKQLSYGDQRRLEIARALATEPKLLALDEPAAGMNAGERQALTKLIEKLRASDITILLIEHDVKLVMGLCDRIVVLDYGKKIADGPANIVRNHPDVIAAYLGSPPETPGDRSS